MTPPEPTAAGPEARAADEAPAVSSCPGAASPRLTGLRHRPDFLAAARARRQGTPSFLLQARRRAEGEPVAPGAIRVGFTASKKVGNAVRRNAAKRRLREAARLVLPSAGRPGWDYVLIARAGETEARPFDALRADLATALAKVHGGGAGEKQGDRPGDRSGDGAGGRSGG